MTQDEKITSLTGTFPWFSEPLAERLARKLSEDDIRAIQADCAKSSTWKLINWCRQTLKLQTQRDRISELGEMAAQEQELP